MRMIGIYLVFGGAALLGALTVKHGLAALVLADVAVAFLAVAAGYAFHIPGLFGKQADGKLPLWSRLLFWPYFALSYFAYALARRTMDCAPHHEILPGLYLGCRRWRTEEADFKKLGVKAVLDLTSEFGEPEFLRRCGAFLCLPLLDHRPPTVAQLQEAVAYVLEHLERGPVYVHCAVGFGRSATVVAACLLALGRATDPADAVAQLKAIRHRVYVNHRQMAVLTKWHEQQKEKAKP